jgi:hypothetical protein
MKTQSRQAAAIDEIEKFCNFAWKTQRKYARYQRVKHMGAELRAQGIIANR